MHDPFHPRSTLGAKIIISHPQASVSAGVNGTKCIPPTLYIMATAAFALHGCFNHARFGILVSAHARYHDAVLPVGLFVEELYLCLEVILRNRTWRTLKVKVRKPISVV